VEEHRASFIAAMARVASGVTVVTTDGPLGLGGLTVSAMCSLSADPPALLVCINRASYAGRIIRTNGVFCVNILSASQADVARQFSRQAGRTLAERFVGVAWDRLITGAPALKDAIAVFDCNLTRGADFGSHDILIGVVAETQERSGAPLLYLGRTYCIPVPLVEQTKP
jgi:flavin reductase